MKHKSEAHKLILQTSPILICWNLLKHICECNYGAKTHNGTKVRHAIYNYNNNLINFFFPQVSYPPTWCGITN